MKPKTTPEDGKTTYVHGSGKLILWKWLSFLSKSNLQIQCNPNKNSWAILQRDRKKNVKTIWRGKKLIWKHKTPRMAKVVLNRRILLEVSPPLTLLEDRATVIETAWPWQQNTHTHTQNNGVWDTNGSAGNSSYLISGEDAKSLHSGKRQHLQ